MPGAGKSTVGRHLARRLDIPFADTDAIIERRLGSSVREHFEREGEASFRALEAETLAELTRAGAGVIATGGGIVLRDSNRSLLREHSVCIYLRSTAEELFRRLRHDTRRPLLQVADPLARLREMHAVRDRLYRSCAHFVVETGRPSVPTLVNMILMQLELAAAIDLDAARSPIDPIG